MLAALPTPTPLINSNTIVTIFPAARFTDISTLLNIIVPLVTIIATFAMGAAFARAAFLVISAGDDAEKLSQARQTALYAAIGLVVMISAYLIVKLIGIMFKIEIPI